jgi:drug/metabolite transporter (DMT)-like permease
VEARRHAGDDLSSMPPKFFGVLMKKLSPDTTPTEVTPSQPSEQRIAQIDWRAYLAAGVTVLSWGSAFPSIRAALVAYSPTNLSVLRFLVSSLALAIYAVITRMRLPRWKDIPAFALLGFIGVSYYNVALNVGEVHVPAAETSFLIGSLPIFIALGAVLFLGERLRIWAWVGIVISFVGIAIISLGKSTNFQIDLWALLLLSCAIATSIYSLGQKPLLTRYTAIECTSYLFWMGTIFLLVFAPDLFTKIGQMPFSATGAVIYLGIFPGAIGYVCWSYALSRLSGSTLASFPFLIPLVASLIAWVWLGEVPSLLILAGGVLVLLGVMVVNMLGHRKKR